MSLNNVIKAHVKKQSSTEVVVNAFLFPYYLSSVVCYYHFSVIYMGSKDLAFLTIFFFYKAGLLGYHLLRYRKFPAPQKVPISASVLITISHSSHSVISVYFNFP